VMAELSRQWQIIVFSHHAHLAALAESLSLEALTVASLAPPLDIEAHRTAEDVRSRARTAPAAAAPAPSMAPVSRPFPPRPSRPSVAGNTPLTTSPGAVREWARSVGYEIGERGRIPADVTAAYEQAHRG